MTRWSRIAAEKSFDELTKAAASGMSRRRLLRLAAGAAAVALLPTAPGEAQAAAKPKVKCKKSSQCGICQSCVNGLCVPACRPGCTGCVPLTTGGHVCVILKSCRSCEHCSDGTCIDDCPAGETCCGPLSGENCVNTNADPQNCGACGNVCPAGQQCFGGVCDCVVSAASVDDPQNCGGCGIACRPDQVCTNGVCECAGGRPECSGRCCSSSTDCCGGACVDTSADNNNCGTCGTTCPAGTTCNGGTCACISGLKPCGGVCVPTDWASCFRSDLGSYCCPPGPSPCSSSAPSGCT